jgi:hypothetical protein
MTGLVLLAAIAVIGWLAVRDQRAARLARVHLLDAAAPLFDRSLITHEEDGFPRLTGRRAASNIDVRLLSDTMTMRRLPQLWLQVTVLRRRPGLASLAVLARPSGYEFYSLTERLHHVIDPPEGLPSEIIVRGDNARAEALLEKAHAALAAILADPKVKEVVIAPEGVRILRQAAEGRRGEHLLLRQAVFDDAAVSAETLSNILEAIRGLEAAVEAPPAQRANVA